MPICILCSSPTKTKEHIFPAAMGGRRENSKIYCKHHNHRLGELVPVLQKQMSLANALIAVRGDRDKRPKAFSFDTPDGESYEMLNGDFSVRLPDTVEDIPVQTDGSRIIKIANDEQFAKWTEEQRKNGWEVTLSGPKHVKTMYHTSPINMTQSFGGPDFLRAVGYLGLTFFAVYFGDEARQGGLQNFKDFVTTTAEPGKNVWWDRRDVETTVGTNKYLFGHTIVVGISRETSRGYGLVSFFSALTFGLDFGPINTGESVEYIVNIDPKAEWAQPGVDVFDVKNEVPHVEVKFAASDLTEMVETGSAAAGFARFLHRASDWRLNQDASQLMKKLTALQAKEASLRFDGACHELAGQKQRILNLLTKAAEMIQTDMAVGQLAFMSAHAKGLIVADESQPNGLAVHSNQYVDMATEQVAREITDLLSKGDLTTDKVAMLIGGGLGLEVAMRQVLIPAIAEALTAAGDHRGTVLSAAFLPRK